MNAAENEYKRIAVIRLSSLGDIIHGIPAFGILRQRFPRARISWFAEPAGAKLLQHIEGIDEIIVLNLKTGGFYTKLKEARRLIRQHRNRFDLVLDFQGLLKSAVLSWFLNGRTLGFDRANLREPQARYFYRGRVGPFDEKRHVILKNIHLVRGVSTHDPGNGDAVHYPLKPLARSPKLEAFLAANHLEKNNYIILNVGAAWQSKVLDTTQYIDLVDRINPGNNHQRNHQKRIVVLWGTEAEKHTAREICRRTGAVMTEFFDFGELIHFIRDSRLLVSADTLALHIADMVQTPSVGIFGPTSPSRNGSLLADSIAVYQTLECSFCYKKKCDLGKCIKTIDLNDIIGAIEKIHEKCN